MYFDEELHTDVLAHLAQDHLHDLPQQLPYRQRHVLLHQILDLNVLEYLLQQFEPHPLALLDVLHREISTYLDHLLQSQEQLGLVRCLPSGQLLDCVIGELAEDVDEDGEALADLALLDRQVRHGWLVVGLLADAIGFVQWVVHGAEEELHVVLLVLDHDVEVDEFEFGFEAVLGFEE